jgi:hypothetical protein
MLMDWTVKEFEKMRLLASHGFPDRKRDAELSIGHMTQNPVLVFLSMDMVLFGRA